MTEQPPLGPEPPSGTGAAPQPSGSAPPPPPPVYAPTGQPPDAPGTAGEGNSSAITSLVLGVVGLVLVLVSFGILSVLTVFLGIAAVILGVAGRRKVSSGRTTQHGGLAMGGLITGIITLVLSIAGLVACGAIVSSGDFQKGFKQGYEQQQRQQQQQP